MPECAHDCNLDITGAAIHHGSKLDLAYGEGVSAGDSFSLGDLKLEILETPGHTDESISIVVKDTIFSDDAVAVFTGDALFIGDVDRTDFCLLFLPFVRPQT